MKDISNIKPKRILVCQLRQIGDVVLSTPCVSLLKKRFPNALIDILTEAKCADVYTNNPDVERVWPINKAELKNPIKALKYYRRIGRSGYDLIVDFQQLPRCRWVVLFSDAEVKLSYRPPWYNRPLYTNWPEEIPPAFAGEYKAGVLKPLDISWDGERPVIYVSDEEQSRAEKVLKDHGLTANERLITIDASHKRETRRWPAKYYSELIDLLAQRMENTRFFLLYGPGERDVALEVKEKADKKDRCIVLEKNGSLRDMAAIIKRAVLHIGNCSGPRHFAVAVGTPSIVIPGSSSSAWTFPSPEHIEVLSDMDCQPCGKEECATGDFACLQNVTPQQVCSIISYNLDMLYKAKR